MNFLFDISYWPARWNCGQWSKLLGYTNIIAEFMIWGAYMTIPVILVYFIRKRRDIPFHKVFILFSLFIFSCGFAHLIEGVIFYYPVYRFLTAMLVVTAIISWMTAIALIPILPKIFLLPSLANINAMLKKDICQLNERLEVAIETLDAGVWDWNLASGQIVLSNSLIKLLGLPIDRNTIPSSEFFDFIFFEDKERIVGAISGSLTNGERQVVRFRMLIQKNNVFYVGMTWKVLVDNNKQSTRVVGTITKQG